MQKLHRVAVGADVGIDLEPALGRREVERSEQAFETPFLVRQLAFLGECWRGQQTGGEHPRQKGTQLAHHAFSIGLAAAFRGSGPPPCPPRTGWLMLSGSGN